MDEPAWLARIKTPRVGVAAVVESEDRTRVALIEREFPPLGLAFPGGFMELGETVHETAVREVKEETDLSARVLGFLTLHSSPKADARTHVVSVFLVMRTGDEEVRCGDDAKDAFWWPWEDESLDDRFASYYADVMVKYRAWRRGSFPLLEVM